MDGPPPNDPSVLDEGGSPTTPATQQPSSSDQAASSLSNSTNTRSTRTSTPISMAGPRQQQTHQLLSANYANRLTPPKATQSALLPPSGTTPELKAKAPENDLFSLDFNSPPAPAASVPEPKKDVKQDILSLFTPNPVAAASPIQTASTTMQNHILNWQGDVSQQQPVAATSMMGTTGTSMWGASSGWTGPAPVIPAQPNIWNTTTQPQPNLFDTNSIWGGFSAPNSTTSTTTTTQQSWETTNNAAQKKDEVFGDIWGGFK